MAASIPLVQSAPNFLMNTTLICSGCFQIVELCHTCTCAMILSYIMFVRHEHMVFSAFASIPTSLLATTKASVFFFIVCMFSRAMISKPKDLRTSGGLEKGEDGYKDLWPML
jgi:hypothetical protein